MFPQQAAESHIPISLIPDGVFILDDSGQFTYINDILLTAIKRNRSHLMKRLCTDILRVEDRKTVEAKWEAVASGGRVPPFDAAFFDASGKEFWVEINPCLMREIGRGGGIFCIARDINSCRDKEACLLEQTERLNQTETTISLLVDKLAKLKRELQETVILNVDVMVCPYLSRLEKTALDAEQKALLQKIKIEFESVGVPLIEKTALRKIHLTPMEFHVARLIKDGKSSKAIAEVLDLSTRTIETHRDNIRKKLGLTGKKINLRSHLNFLS